jgi:RNA polymerase sigma-70 factor (ECF subfamily)
MQPVEQQRFADLVRQHQGMVYSLAWNIIRNPAVAEEIAQDVFLQLHRNLAGIESPSHMVHWLRRVTMQRAIDQSRRAKLRPHLTLEQAPEPRQPAAPTDPLLSSHLARLIRGLPERARAVVVLRYQEDLDPAEIAETLDMPLGTVKSSLNRALTTLRSRLERVLSPKGASV